MDVLSNHGSNNFREGDWNCNSCQGHNFASKTACFKCGVPRGGLPQGQLMQPMGAAAKPNFRHGDWSCPSCQAHNFASKAACFKCRAAKPGGMDGALALAGLDQSALLQNLMTQNLLGMMGGSSGLDGLGNLGNLSGYCNPYPLCLLTRVGPLIWLGLLLA